MTATTGARRLRQPSWRDPRLLIGVLLVFASVAAGARVLSTADRTAPVYVARTTLPAGRALDRSDLSVARLRLTGSSARYLDAGRPVPSGLVLQRTVGAGELVPVAALAEAAALASRPVGIPLDGGVPAGIVPGGLVDIWSAESDSRAAGSTATATPRRIATAVEVYHVGAAGQAGLAAGRAATVQVLVPEAQVPVVLAALADGASVSLLPLPGGVP